MYSPELLDHFEHPRNAGELADATAQQRIENPACGDILELAVKSGRRPCGRYTLSGERMCSRDGMCVGADGTGKGKLCCRSSVRSARKMWFGVWAASRRRRVTPRSWQSTRCKRYWVHISDSGTICRYGDLSDGAGKLNNTACRRICILCERRDLHLRFSGKAVYHRGVLQSPHFPCRRSSRRNFQAPDGRN